MTAILVTFNSLRQYLILYNQILYPISHFNIIHLMNFNSYTWNNNYIIPKLIIMFLFMFLQNTNFYRILIICDVEFINLALSTTKLRYRQLALQLSITQLISIRVGTGINFSVFNMLVVDITYSLIVCTQGKLSSKMKMEDQ